MSPPPFTPKHTNLVSLFQASVEKFAHKPLFGVRKNGSWQWFTYKEFSEQVDRFRTALGLLGIGRGDRVAVIANNRLEWAVGAYASYQLGAIYVPMYETQLDKEWQFILKDSGARAVLVANDAVYDRVAGIKGECPALDHIINFEGSAPDNTSYKHLIEKAKDQLIPPIIPDGKEIASIIYTSGTTGNPKGVRVRHINHASNVSSSFTMVPFVEGERSLAFLPWAHVFGGSAELHGMVSIGGCMAICEDVSKILDQLTEVRPTVLVAVPRIWNRIYDGVQKQMASKPKLIQTIFRVGMRAAGKAKHHQPISLRERLALTLAKKLIFGKIVAKFGGELKYAISGAAALSKEVAEFIDNLGILVFEGYGMTETTAGATFNSPEARKIGTVGKALPGVTIVLDKTVAGADEKNGEILIGGHSIMEGYHNLPEETARVLTSDGAMRSGDLGYLDEDGFLVITGRVKELYKLENGKYVAPAPLEEKLTLSPYIAQAMVHGSDKPYNVAIIVPDMTSLKEWAQKEGLGNLAPDALVNHEKTHRLIEAEIDTYSAEFKAFDRIKKFMLVTEEFTMANDMLTPTLKVKRRNVVNKYGGDLEKLFTSGTASRKGTSPEARA